MGRTCRTARPGRRRRGSCAHCPGTVAAAPASPPECTRPPTRPQPACSGARPAAAPAHGTRWSQPPRCLTAAAAGRHKSCGKLVVRGCRAVFRWQSDRKEPTQKTSFRMLMVSRHRPHPCACEEGWRLKLSAGGVGTLDTLPAQNRQF